MKFSLVDEPWIPVEADAVTQEVSLRDALTRAHKITRLEPDVPTMAPAILRQVLLPIVLDAMGVPRNNAEWSERWRSGRLDPEQIERYLEEHRDRFDLFHAAWPFGQAAELRTSRNWQGSSSLLVPTLGWGTRIPLFAARTADDPPALKASVAARWVLHAHCWDTAGIKTGAVGDPKVKGGKTLGNPTGPLGQLGVVLPVGRTLFETLLLNVPIRPDGLHPKDEPSWRRPPATSAWEERKPVGIMDLLTWQARRVRLFPTYEAGELRVRSVLVTAGDRMLSIPRDEPHTTWRHVEKPARGKPPYSPLRHQPGHTAWRGLGALLALPDVRDGKDVETSYFLGQIADLQEEGFLAETYPLGVEAVGIVYGTQAAVVDDVTADSIPLPVVALRSGSVEARRFVEGLAADAGELAAAVDRLDADLRRAAGGDPTPWNRGQRPGTLVIQQIDPVVRRVLAGLQHEPHRLEEAWAAWVIAARRVVNEVAEGLLAGVPPKAFAGRSDADGRRTWRASTAELTFRRRVAEVLSVPEDAEQERAVLPS